MRTLLEQHITSFYDLLATEEVLLTAATANNLLYAVPVMFSMFVIVCMIMTILLIFKNLKNNVAILIFLAGLASRVIVAFSPTIFVSKTRTMIFFDFSMIAITYLIWEELSKNKEHDKALNIVNSLIKFSAVVQVLNTIIYIYSKQKLY